MKKKFVEEKNLAYGLENEEKIIPVIVSKCAKMLKDKKEEESKSLFK